MEDYKKGKEDGKKKVNKIALLVSVIITCLLFARAIYFPNTIDPCKCIKISSKKDLGLSYDESYWNKCVDKYYSVGNLFNECVTED
tara:strand:+ start:187 stop:444 length:258 start_codon:yes stop_codon:yes gene_type:complete